MIQLIKGSNKDLRIEGKKLTFDFSDRFSLFDYGSFPFEIPGKGDGQKLFAINLDRFIKKYIDTAFISYEPLTQNYYDKSEFIPLEFIFRIGVVPGSSYLKRFPEIKPYTKFITPIIETSTKLEDSDRLISFEEAIKISPHPIEKLLYEVMPKLSLALNSYFEKAGLELWDGKFEFAYRDGEYILIDAITQDELRFSMNHQECSKELIRFPYRETTWFKNKMDGIPPTFNSKMIKAISEIYYYTAKVLEDKSFKTKLEQALTDYKENLWHAF